MAHKLHRNRDVIRLLEQMLEDAKSGEITDVFVVFRQADREYGHEYAADNLPDMLLQVGTALMTERIENGGQEPRKH